MKKRSVILLMLTIVISLSLFAAEQTGTTEPASSGGGMDIFEVLLVSGYLLGVFILLPLVIYSNLKEGLFDSEEAELQLKEDLTESERNDVSITILEKLESKLTEFEDDDGNLLVTITKGSQSKFMKSGLDYINKYLAPNDVLIQQRVLEFEEVYNDRAHRVFTGSWWIIICSIAVGVLMLMTGGVNTFIFIHALGILFYVLSSRTTMYGIEKRMNKLGYMPGFLRNMMSGLFLGNGTKYYVKSGDGPWKRDWETEGQMAMIGLLIMVMVSLVLGFMAPLLGVLNFALNYSTSFILPFKSDENWYNDNFSTSTENVLEAA
jgi:hypothetical protein